jgi:hypothetical protein
VAHALRVAPSLVGLWIAGHKLLRYDSPSWGRLRRRASGGHERRRRRR